MLKKKTIRTSIAIIGAGHAGLSLSVLLGAAGIDVVCIDSENPKNFDTKIDQRTTAISYGSSQILRKTGIWDTILKQTCPIKDIHILDGSHSNVLLDFLSKDTNQDAFGWLIENNILRKALYQQAKKTKNLTHVTQTKVSNMERHDDGVTIHCDTGQTIETQLVIGADGRQSFTRQWAGITTRNWSYDQNAVVCIVEHENDHKNVAVEHFFNEGPFAILPMTSHKKDKYRSSIVWTEESNTPKSLLDYDDNTFNHALNARFPKSYGQVKRISKRFSYPLNFSHAHEYTANRIALIADAAHGIHPIAGQGLNLGLRDVDVLADLLVTAYKNGEDISRQDILNEYETKRRLDNMSMSMATDNLNSLFSNNSKSIRALRKLGLKATAHLKPAKQFFMKQAMGEK